MRQYLLVKFASICGATVSKYWKPNVTHVIAATDEKGACSRTLKLLKAILNGRWILKIDWIKACMEAMHPIDEEPYEVSLDNHGCCDGPKSGRLRSLDNAPKLFHGFNFYFIGDFIPIYQEELVKLVIIAGGTVIGNKEGLFKQNHDDAQATRTLVVYNNDPAQWCKIEDEEGCVVEPKRLKAAEDLANEIGSQAIGHTWLLESIAASKV
ncbi:non-specific serine,threonine protein kinase, partial [Sarracenia purpurea var. burkii]